ncbi:MAG TPA: hypothetical protein VM265_07890 [Sphingomicrobium sp.]|nr:hypothetical protein [Sphingomicrobium sp.]
MAGVPVGLDFAAVLASAEAQGAGTGLIAEILPDIEVVLLTALAEGEDAEE